MRARDYQRSKLYRAEECVRGAKWIPVEECRALVTRYLPHAAYKTVNGPKAYMLPRGAVEHVRRGFYLSVKQTTIVIPYCGQRLPIVLHEIAHGMLNGDSADGRTYSPHGRTFATLLLRLLSAHDLATAHRLRESFDGCRVKYWAHLVGDNH